MAKAKSSIRITEDAVRGRRADGTIHSERGDRLAGEILNRAGQVLSKPGISRGVVFRSDKVYAYSIDPKNVTRVLRESSDGTKVSGKVVDGKFRAIPKPK
jgi:hypothetical protein